MSHQPAHDTAWTARGACPGVAAPMASGDGLLLRLRHPVGGLSPTQARAVAAAARDHGNGALELTSRGNLQLRGVTEEQLPAAQAALAATGLVDTDPGREAVRNVLAAPASDQDPTARMDVTDVAQAVSAAIADDPTLRGLAPKTGIVVDGGGRAAIPGVTADIRLDACGGDRLRLGLAGQREDAMAIGSVAATGAPAAVRRLLKALLDASDGEPMRMAAALRTHGAEPFRAALDGVAEPGDPGLPALPAACAPGVDAEGDWFLAIFAFGAVDAERLNGLAAVSEQYARSEPAIRLTPWRGVLLPGVGDDAREALLELGAVLDPQDLRLRLGACVGAPACASGSTPTRPDAEALAAAAPRLLAGGDRVHVSGCGKGCGAPGTAAVMLVAEHGRYAMALNAGVAATPDWDPAPPAAVRARLAAIDTVLAREGAPGEGLAQLINRRGHATVVRLIDEENARV